MMQTFRVAPLPDNEARRLAALDEYAPLESGGAEFDAFAQLAAHFCGAPIAFIGLIGSDRQRFVANVGLADLHETRRDVAFCAHAILGDAPLEVPDALRDERFAGNPLVVGYPHIRSYTGVPLVVAGGLALGTLCVADRRPRTLSGDQRAALCAIAALIVRQLEKNRSLMRLIDATPAELYAIDAATGSIQCASAVAARRSGHSVRELRALRLHDVLPEIAVGKLAAFVDGLRHRATAPEPVRSTLQRGDGRADTADVRFELVEGVHGEMILALCEPAATAALTIDADAAPPLESHQARLTIVAALARNLFEALDPRALVDALVRGIDALTAGGTARLLVRDVRGDFSLAHNLARRTDAPVVKDELLRSVAAGADVLLSDDGARAAVRILAPSGELAYVLDIRAAERRFGAIDARAFDLLGQYLAVAIRNVELFGELQSRRSAVVELNQVKNDLIAMLAHDFKGPLTTIVGLADVLAEDERFDAESRRLLGMINSSAMRLASLATDTLALSRLDQNELSLRLESVDIVALVRDIVRVLGVTRSIDMRSSVAVSVVQADPARLRQVFENVIGNAIKYSPRGDAVDVVLAEKRGGVEVAIRDRGIGIPAGDLPKLFGRFARGSNARELGIGGTGFGLYLARTIVERHGGTISVESNDGSGSTFCVYVPTAPGTQRSRDRRILLLDDEGDGRSFIAHTLRDEGYAVYPVVTEAEFFAALDERRYDAAIVDCDALTSRVAHVVERVDRRAALVWLVNVTQAEFGGGQTVLRKPFLIKDLQLVVEAAVADRRREPRRR
jgi:signal transduction histidine kinase